MELENQWSKPEGVEVPEGLAAPRPVKYKILNPKTGNVEEHTTEREFDRYFKTWHHAMAPQDQFYADMVAEIIQKACAYFYEPDDTYTPIEGVADIVVSDEEVQERINRLNLGENKREAVGHSARRHEHFDFYPLDELPFDQQRALIEQLLDLKRTYKIELLGEVAFDAPKKYTEYEYD